MRRDPEAAVRAGGAFSPILQAASPFFRDTLEDVSGSATIPVRQLRTHGS
jgi:hypothetical protein